MDAKPPTSRRPEFGFFTEFSQAPGMSEAVAFEQAVVRRARHAAAGVKSL
jgi:hypothetical protein